jgi:hypothetical protein
MPCPSVSVGRGQHCRIQGTRAAGGHPAAGHFRQRCDAARVPDRRADEIQERLQVQDRVRGLANGDGSSARLCERRMGSHQGIRHIYKTHTR